MLVNLEVTPRQARMLEDALLAYGANKSEFIRSEIVELVTEIKRAKTETR